MIYLIRGLSVLLRQFVEQQNFILVQYSIVSYFSYLKEYLFPSGCGVCGEALFDPKDAWFGLCADCRSYLSSAFRGEKHCGMCGRPLISEKETCLSCRQNGAADTGLYNERIVKLKTLFPYSGKFRIMLGSYKFKKSLRVGNFLVKCLASAIENLVESSLIHNSHLTGPDPEKPVEAALVPVPPRPGKLKSQGWDQIELLAALLEKEHKRSGHGIPVCRCLKRLPSKSQKDLNREDRKNNLSKRIICTKMPPETAIIIDDVVTTGATLDACAAALLEKGAVRVYAACLFYD